MKAAEVIEREVKGERGLEVRPLPAEGVRQSRQAARVHPGGGVLPFDVRRVNAFGAGVAGDRNLLRAQVAQGSPRRRARAADAEHPGPGGVVSA